jgi:hypothetical protein
VSTPTASDVWDTAGKAAKLKEPGDQITLHITQPIKVQQQRDYDDDDKLLWWDAEQTRPKMETLITGQVDDYDENDDEDTGKRTLYVSKWLMEKAIKGALRKSKSGHNMPMPGADLTVKCTGTEPTKGASKKKKADTLLWEAEYTPNAHSAGTDTSSAAPADDEEDEEPPF